MSATTALTNNQRIFTLVPSQQEPNFGTLQALFSPALSLVNIRKAIEKYEQNHNNLNFYRDTLPSICQWASDHEHSSKLVTPLTACSEAKLEYTSKHARYVLANAFFLNTVKIDDTSSYSSYGSLDLKNLYENLSRIAIERLLCFLDYFHQEQILPDTERLITIERYSSDVPPDWCTSTIPILSENVQILADRMESSLNSQGFVDFANKHIQIQRMIASCTQEEILFSCCPEAFLSMLLCESLRDNEIVIVRGCRRYVEYTGYYDTFRYVGHYTYPTSPAIIQDILIMDAVYSHHFQHDNVIRDMNKAYLAFKSASSSSNYKIITGHWGCGAFFGDKTHKFLQQVCVAAALPNVKLDYSVFMEENLVTKFTQLLETINGKMIKDVMEDEDMTK